MYIEKFETLRAPVKGSNHDPIIGIWRIGGDGRAGELRAIAKAAADEVRGHEQKAEMIRADVRRSSFAHQEDIREDAKERLHSLGKAVQRLNDKRAKIKAEAAKLISDFVQPYNGDAAQAVIDIELSRMMRDMDGAKLIAQLTVGTNDALVSAALRLPRELTGISENVYQDTLRAAIARRHPVSANEYDQLQIGLQDAEATVVKAFEMLSKSVSLDERVEAVGGLEAAVTLVKGVAPEALERISNRVHTQRANSSGDAA